MAKAVIRARVTLDGKQSAKELAKQRANAKKFQNSMKAIGGAIAGAFAVGKLISFGKSVIDLGSKLSDLAFATDLTVEQFEAWSFAARRAGADEQKAANTLTKLRAAQAEVIDGTETYVDAFDKLGLSQREVIEMDMPELMEAVAKKITESGNATKEFGALTELIGQKNAPKMLEALNELAEKGFVKLGEDAKEAGQVMGDEMAGRLDAMADKLDFVKRKFAVFFAGIIDKLGTVALFWASVFEDGFGEAADKLNRGEFSSDVFAEKNQEELAKGKETKDLQRAVRVAAFEERLEKEKQTKLSKASGGAGVEKNALRTIGAIGTGQMVSVFREQTNLLRELRDMTKMGLQIDDSIEKNTRTLGGLS